MMSAVFFTDEWTCSLAAIRRAVPRWCRRGQACTASAVSRAVTSADRLAAEPPTRSNRPRAVGQAGEVGEEPQHLVLGMHGTGRLEP